MQIKSIKLYIKAKMASFQHSEDLSFVSALNFKTIKYSRLRNLSETPRTHEKKKIR